MSQETAAAILGRQQPRQRKPIAYRHEDNTDQARQRKDIPMECWLAEIKIRAGRRIGEISRGLQTSKGGQNPNSTLPVGGKSKNKSLEEAGLTTSVANRLEQLSDIPEPEFEELIAESKEKDRPITFQDVERKVQQSNKRGNLKVAYKRLR